MFTRTSAPAAAVRRQVSLFRLALIVAAVGLVAVSSVRCAMSTIADVRPQPATAWVAPYVDVTLTPTLHFEEPSEQVSSNFVLGFVVADSKEACTPSWGTYYGLDAAARALDLDRRIVRLRERGGDAVVSFGGAINHELATVCTDVDQLTEAYAAVVDRYDLHAVDFDIEGAALADGEAHDRRAQAIVHLQEAHPDLEVWLTLPVAPNGLTAASIDLIDRTLAAGVKLAGVNGMTMNYGESRAGMSMEESTEAALKAMFQQLDGAYQRAGDYRTDAQLWKLIGATPMIGLNDVAGDVFTLDDARALHAFGAEMGMGRLSFWSVNRDVGCGAAVDDVRVSNTCSGVPQQPLEFGRIFARDAERLPREVTLAGGPEAASVVILARDDPRTSPYPQWRAARAYEGDEKVSWQGRVYQAKWWTQGDQPDAPVKNVWDTPWRYLGPVLDSDREAMLEARTVIDGTWSKWSADGVYVAGDEVTHGNQVFRAKWWTQGDIPYADPDRPYDHPWEYLGDLARRDPNAPPGAEDAIVPPADLYLP